MGLVAAAVLLVKGVVTVGVGLLATNVFAVLAGTTTDGPLNVVWVLIAADSAWALAVLLHHVDWASTAKQRP